MKDTGVTTKRQRSLYTAAHPKRPFRPTVFDDTLDAHPPFHLYEGTATPAELAAADAKAAQLGLVRKPKRMPSRNGASRGARLKDGDGSRRK